MLMPLVSLSVIGCSATDSGSKQEGSTPREGLAVEAPTVEVSCGGGEGGATGGAASGGAGAGGTATGGAGAGGTSDVGGAGAGGAGAGGTAAGGAGAGGTAAGGAGAGGAAAGAAGSAGAGGPCAGLCANPKNITWSGSYQGGQIGTGAVCLQTTQVVHGGNCGNFVAPRTLSVNGQTRPCNNQNWPTIPPARNGGYCVQTTAGNQPWAFITLW